MEAAALEPPIPPRPALRVVRTRNSLRTTHPNLADPAVWDFATNDARGFTPDNTSLGQHGAVSWLCARHGPYEQQIRVRVRGHGCQTCGDEEARTKARETENRRNRERRAKAREIRAGQGGEVLPFELSEPRGSGEPLPIQRLSEQG